MKIEDFNYNSVYTSPVVFVVVLPSRNNPLIFNLSQKNIIKDLISFYECTGFEMPGRYEYAFPRKISTKF